MALTALKCPNCDANIRVDDDREYGFCAYCGSQVKTKEVVEIRYTNHIQVDDTAILKKQIEDGTAYLKMEEYYSAEKAFHGVIRDYPGEPEGYEMLIRAITRNYRVFMHENLERVGRLADKMVAVAPDERRDYYMSLQQQITKAFSYSIVQQKFEENLQEINSWNKKTKESSTIFCISLVLALIMQFSIHTKDTWTTYMIFFMAAMAFCGAACLLGCKICRKKALLKNKIVETELFESEQMPSFSDFLQ